MPVIPTVKSPGDIHVLTQYDRAKFTWWLASLEVAEKQKKYFQNATQLA